MQSLVLKLLMTCTTLIWCKQISVLPTEILSQPSELGEGGIPVAYQVDTMLKVFAPDINIMDSVLLTTNEARIPA